MGLGKYAGEERVVTYVVKGKLCLVCRDGGGWALVNMGGGGTVVGRHAVK